MRERLQLRLPGEENGPTHAAPFSAVRHTLIAAMLLLLFGWLQFSFDGLSGFDGYFHIAYSKLLAENGFSRQLPWLQFTVHRDAFRDHHLLWHYLLIPFTRGDLLFGAKLAATLFPALAGLAFYHLLQGCGVRQPAAWTFIGLLASHPFLFRMTMLRVQSLSLALLLTVFFFCSKRKNILLFLTAFLFVWMYDAFVLLLLVAFLFYATSAATGGRGYLLPMLAVAAGIIAGMVLNPYFPDNFASLLYNAKRSIFLNVPDMKLGNEWSPYNSWALFQNSLAAFLLFFATILFLPFCQKIKTDELAALILSLIFLTLTLKSRRFIEYWPVFCTLSTALILGRRLSSKTTLCILLLLLPLMIGNLKKAAVDIEEDSLPADLYRGSALWLADNSDNEEVVFHADWDDFPLLFFYNQKNHYIVGLDPMYMYSFDQEKYRLYQEITKGMVEGPAEVIYNTFGSRYIFLDRREHYDFYQQLLKDPQAELAFEDDGGLVFRHVAKKSENIVEKTATE